MSKLAWIVALVVLAATPAAAESAIPDLRGTWKGDSESIVIGPGASFCRSGARAAAQHYCVHDDGDNRMAGGSPARSRRRAARPRHRSDIAQRLDLHGGRRWLYRRNAGAQPDRACYMRQTPDARVASARR